MPNRTPTHVRDGEVIRDIATGGHVTYKSINEAKRASRQLQTKGSIVTVAKPELPQWTGCKGRRAYKAQPGHVATYKPKMSRVDAQVESRRFAPAND